jgi:heme-degrading monooxygenase HmoA
MPHKILTEVTAVLAEDRAVDVVSAFDELLRRPTPDGLLRTELLRGQGGQWRIQSLWRDREAVDAMRAGSDPPAAPALFRQLGADPTLNVFEVRSTYDVLG